MKRMIFLAWRYIQHYKAVSIILLTSITATLYLPFTINILVQRLENQLFARADATPIIIGAKGSRFDLTLNAIYYDARVPHLINMSEVILVRNSYLATPIPLHIRFKAQGYPIVGTTLEYFDFRKLQINNGTMIGKLGDCVLGADAAKSLQLKPGDRLMSDPENVFDIGGNYPLNMKVVGILNKTHSPDDNAVFVDIKTAWIIEGIGHGHQELTSTSDSSVILGQSDSQIVANAALPQFTEINDDNINSFHFHRNEAEMPLTALIAIPSDKKSGIILEGRYNNDNANAQLLRPRKVIDDMMAMVLEIQKLINAGMTVVASATGLFLVLVIMLSSRLRKNEMRTMFKLGCSRLTIFWLQFFEVVLIIIASAILALVLSVISLPFATEIIKKIIT